MKYNFSSKQTHLTIKPILIPESSDTNTWVHSSPQQLSKNSHSVNFSNFSKDLEKLHNFRDEFTNFEEDDTDEAQNLNLGGNEEIRSFRPGDWMKQMPNTPGTKDCNLG